MSQSPWNSAWQQLPQAISAFGKGDLKRSENPGDLAAALMHQTGERWMTVGFQLVSDAHEASEAAWLLVSFPSPSDARLGSKLTELGNILASRLAMGMEATPVTLTPPTELKPKRWQQILSSAREVTQQLYSFRDGEISIPMQITLLSGLRGEGSTARGQA